MVVQNGRSNNASAIVRTIATFGRALVASPAYLEEHGTPKSVEDLAKHSCIIHENGPESDRWNSPVQPDQFMSG